MRIEYTFPGTKQQNIVIPGTQGIPRKGESVLFMQDEEEREFTVHHVIHIHDNDDHGTWVQVVLR